MSASRFTFVVLLVCLVSGCGDAQQSSSPDLYQRLKEGDSQSVAVTSYPLGFLVSRIAGDEVEVILPTIDRVGKAAQPGSDAINKMQLADLIFTNGSGAPFAQWLDRVSLPAEKMAPTTKAFSSSEFILIKEHQIVHQHGPEGEHSHGFLVAHTWLDPKLALKQASQIQKSLIAKYPDKSQTFEDNFKSLKSELEQLASSLANIKPPTSPVLAINPNMQFLFRAANWEVPYQLWFHDSDPKEELAKLEEKLTQMSDSGKSIDLLVPADFHAIDAHLESLEDKFNLRVRLIENFDQKPKNTDYLHGMQANLNVLQELVQP